MLVNDLLAEDALAQDFVIMLELAATLFIFLRQGLQQLVL